jgi:hypothetical protein
LAVLRKTTEAVARQRECEGDQREDMKIFLIRTYRKVAEKGEGER